MMWQLERFSELVMVMLFAAGFGRVLIVGVSPCMNFDNIEVPQPCGGTIVETAIGGVLNSQGTVEEGMFRESNHTFGRLEESAKTVKIASASFSLLIAADNFSFDLPDHC